MIRINKYILVGTIITALICSTWADDTGVISNEIIRPQKLNSFNPPSGAGSSYVDPAFGTRITRVTDNTKFNQFVLGGYMGNSEISYFNKDGSYFVAAEDEYINGLIRIATFLYDGITGARIRMIGQFEPYQLRWPMANAYTRNGQKVTFDPRYYFYKYSGNEIQLWDVRTPGNYTVIKKFTEYSEIGPAGGEGDVSKDGRYWVLDGDAHELFVYDLIDDKKLPVSTFDLGSLGSKGGNVGVDYAAISPLGNYVIVSWGTDPGAGKRYAGIELYDKNWNFIRQLHPSIVHWENGVDAFGDEVIYSVVTHDFPGVFAGIGATPGDIVSVRLSDGQQRLLADVPNWAHMAMTACNYVTSGKYVYVSYHNRSSDPIKLWAPYWDEVIEVPTDGSQQVRRFVHHLSHFVEGQTQKYYQPDPMINRQGTKMIYRSTYNTGIGDLYMFDIGPRDVDQTDNVAPNPPLNLRQGRTTFNSIELVWDEPAAASDGDVPLAYKILRNNTAVATVFETAYIDNGLAEGTSYDYKIYGIDDANNQSSGFVTAVFSTAADIEPPTLPGVVIQSATEVRLLFSEALDRVSAENAGNYKINNGVTVLAAALQADLKTVLLTTSEMDLGVVYTLTVNNVADASSRRNVIAKDTKKLFSLLAGFYDDFEDGQHAAWSFRTPSRWEIAADGGNHSLFLNTTDYGDYSKKMLGEYAVLSGSEQWGDNFRALCQAKSNEDLLANTTADYAILFGFVDDLNYYYVQFHPDDIKLHRIVNGERTLYEEHPHLSDFEVFLPVAIELANGHLHILVDNHEVVTYDLSGQGPITGQIGIGSFNDSAWFDNINIGPYDQGDDTPPAAPTGLVIVDQE